MEIERELATPSAILYTWSAVMACMCVACITMQHVFKEFNKLWKMISLAPFWFVFDLRNMLIRGRVQWILRKWPDHCLRWSFNTLYEVEAKIVRDMLKRSGNAKVELINISH